MRADFPLYNIKSGRTHRAQSAYLERHPDLKRDFFQDPEDQRVQQAQKEILLRMIGEKDLDEDLKDKKQQTPLVLTKDGYIVDGNRRITALREQGVTYVTAVVLPEDATADEIYETELTLQMARDTKAEYNWIDELLHIQYGIEELGEKAADIATKMRKSVEAIAADLEILSYVNQYLEWASARGQFHKVPQNSKQPFIDLSLGLKGQAVKGLSKTAKEAIKVACFAAIHSSSGYEAIRDIIRRLSKQAEAVVEKLREQGIKEGKTSHKVKGADDDEDPLARLAAADAKGTGTPHVTLAAVFSDPDRAKAAVEPLMTAIDELAEEEREESRSNNPLRALTRAEALLKKIRLDANCRGDAKIGQTLEAITEHVDRLAQELAGTKKKR